MRVQIAAINKIGRVRGGVGHGNVVPGTVGNLRQVGARARGGVGDRRGSKVIVRGGRLTFLATYSHMKMCTHAAHKKRNVDMA